VEDIVDEAKRLVDNGALEITLLGQNVNAFHGESKTGDVWGLGSLIREVAKINGLERIRYTTSHPRDMDDDLIAVHGSVEKLQPFLHLPVQSGSDKILKAMNRKHTAAEYIALIARIRAARPDILISGDFIVGFPEESAQDFEDTMELVRQVRYGQAFSFKYSARPGTPAAERVDVAQAEADERLQRLQALLRAQQAEVQESMVGREVGVLFEKPGRLPGQMVGKSDYLHAVHVQTDAPIGSLARVRIVDSGSNSLAGEIVDKPD
jgi:tRNA-2-methylthio-N6-dimethylallyladenosine synthase